MLTKEKYLLLMKTFDKINRSNYQQIISVLTPEERKYLIMYLFKTRNSLLYDSFVSILRCSENETHREVYKTCYIKAISKEPKVLSLKLMNIDFLIQWFTVPEIEMLFSKLKGNITSGFYSSEEILDVLEIVTIPSEDIEILKRNQKSKTEQITCYNKQAKQVHNKAFRKLKDLKSEEIYERLKPLLRDLPHQYYPYYNIDLKEFSGTAKTKK